MLRRDQRRLLSLCRRTGLYIAAPGGFATDRSLGGRESKRGLMDHGTSHAKDHYREQSNTC
jgi:hypothetical protein